MARITTFGSIDSFTFVANRTGNVSVAQDLRSGDTSPTNLTPFYVQEDCIMDKVITQTPSAYGSWTVDVLKSSDGGLNYSSVGTYTDGTPAKAIVSMTAVSDVVEVTAHGLAVDDTIKFVGSGTLPPEVSFDTVYYVVNVTGVDTFAISATQGGAAIDFSVSASGTNYILYENTLPTVTVPSESFLSGDLVRLRFIPDATIATTINNPQGTIHLTRV